MALDTTEYHQWADLQYDQLGATAYSRIRERDHLAEQRRLERAAVRRVAAASTAPQKGGWAPGGYACWCFTCSSPFTGDKRAVTCADCVYREPSAEVVAG